MTSPIEQFEIHTLTAPLFHVGASPVAFTSSAAWMIVAGTLCLGGMALALRKQALVPGRAQAVVEALYDMIVDLVDNAAGEKSRPFFPFIFALFLFIMACNLMGMMPHVLTVTSHLAVNLALAGILFLVIFTTGLVRNGLGFFRLFLPPGVPMLLVPFMVLIELVSFLIRPFSLSMRLAANMFAGHILMKVFAGMTAGLVATMSGLAVVGILPLVLNVAIIGFEFFVALLQAYIFAILSAVYLRDALEVHH